MIKKIKIKRSTNYLWLFYKRKNILQRNI